MTGSADLTAALRAHARGLHCLQAAVELLIGHARGCGKATSSTCSCTPFPA